MLTKRGRGDKECFIVQPINYAMSTGMATFDNNGDGTFTDVPRNSGVAAHAGRSMGMICADCDNDGDTCASSSARKVDSHIRVHGVQPVLAAIVDQDAAGLVVGDDRVLRIFLPADQIG